MPPDHISANMAPNPGDGDRQRSRDEEARRQRAIQAMIIEEARRAGLTVSTEPGLIYPDAKPNPERSEAIKRETNPALASFSRMVGRSLEAEQIKTPDGHIIKGLKFREGSQTQLAVNLKELADLAHRFLGFLSDVKDAVIGLAVRVGAAMGVPAGEPSQSSEQDDWDDDSDENGYPIDDGSD